MTEIIVNNPVTTTLTVAGTATQTLVIIESEEPQTSVVFSADQGPQGTPGDTGPTGPANTLTIGTVVGSTTATASITGTSPNQTLNLGLPTGAQGPTGPTGACLLYTSPRPRD